MAKLIITDGIALVKLSRAQNYLLGRSYVAFDLNQMLKVSVLTTPKKIELGQRTKHGWMPLSITGEYQTGVKRTLFIGPKKVRCVRILLLNPSLGEIYLTSGDQLELFAVLKGHQSDKIYPKD